MSGPQCRTDPEPFDTHREIVCTRSTGNKDTWKCVDCGGKLVQTGVRLPNGHLANPNGSGTLTTKICTAWRASDA